VLPEISSTGGREAALARLQAVLHRLEASRTGAPSAGPSPGPSGGDAGPCSDAARLAGEEGAVRTLWPGVDALGGLSRDVVHEWFGVAEPGVGPESVGRSRVAPPPPLRLLAWLAHRAWLPGAPSHGRFVCWIGARVRPYPRALLSERPAAEWEPESTAEVALEPVVPEPGAPEPGAMRAIDAGPSSRLLASSLFVDPPDEGARLWAIDLAVRCPALAAVVADGRGLDMAGSRRLQLAVERGAQEARGAHGGPLVLLARPPSERGVPSVAGTRWWVERAAGAVPRWTLELLRWKAARTLGSLRTNFGALGEVGRRWTLEWNHASGAVSESAVVVDRSGEAASGSTGDASGDARGPSARPRSGGGLSSSPPPGVAAG